MNFQNVRKKHYRILFDMMKKKHKSFRYVDANHDEHNYREFIEKKIKMKKKFKTKLHNEKQKIQKKTKIENSRFEKIIQN